MMSERVFKGSNGHRIIKYPARCFNQRILKDIVDKSFNVNAGDNYFRLVLRDNSIIYFEVDSKGIQVFVPNPGYGITPHIRTIAVLPQHRKNGVASDLVEAVLEDYHKFNLRTLENNEEAKALYSGIIGPSIPLKAKNGMHFLAYLLNHSPEEAQNALRYLAKQPYFFK